MRSVRIDGDRLASCGTPIAIGGMPAVLNSTSANGGSAVPSGGRVATASGDGAERTQKQRCDENDPGHSDGAENDLKPQRASGFSETSFSVASSERPAKGRFGIAAASNDLSGLRSCGSGRVDLDRCSIIAAPTVE